MFRQLQLKAPFKGLQLKRSLTYNPKQAQPIALVEVPETVEQEPQFKLKSTAGRYVSQLFIKIASKMVKCSASCPLGYSSSRMELPICVMSRTDIRRYSVCLNPLEQSQIDQGKPNRTTSVSIGYTDMAVEQPNGTAVAPIEHPSVDQTLKSTGTGAAKPPPQPNVPEPPARKVPYYNPLRRRSNVDPARVQYIKDRFKERTMETTDTNKPQGKKFVSRTTLHSGRLDKID
ncbi:hypothetical protein AWZ03_013947 [Drosophila navojoa]|uniref:Uncharacterized protein n=1 Tax=Drosophila navojoa TaxID=7232 RepID=A0A484AVK2_DRONA|nr:uncharacterized protein LOC115565050 [Drosophila navojoa]TDG39631.1 hypothetical protein AWZ03_013947 [Drosophila navojoa]